jgi:hypothetical protein
MICWTFATAICGIACSRDLASAIASDLVFALLALVAPDILRFGQHVPAHRLIQLSAVGARR